jgi:hypothetical protein
METFESLAGYCAENGRAVPLPNAWDELYKLLRNIRRKASGGFDPPPPLILAAWSHSLPIEKVIRFKEHLRWAEKENQLDQVGAFLRSLPEEKWAHFGELPT